MSYKALYRTYRPHSFETVVGQKHIVQTLQNALKHNKMSHAYLFCGPRGTGKTTVAKLVAKSVNCLNPEKAPCNECEHCRTIQNGTHPDVIEIDAASNNGVDEIRDLIEKVKYAPLQAKYKVYIIDEVHMLSQGAFNALLKTLEEPPAHVIFILATTEPHKVLPTIISRCQRYDFVRVSMKEIQDRVEEVLNTEKIEFDPEATRLISQLADGGVRDALSILEQCIAYSGKKLTAQHVNDIYGIATTQDKLRLLDAIIKSDVAQLMAEIDEITQKNIDIRRLTNDLMELLKESVVYDFTKDTKLLNKLSADEAKSLNRINRITGLKMIEDLMDTAEKYRSASNLLSYFEIGLLKVMGRLNQNDKPSVDSVDRKIDRTVDVLPTVAKHDSQKEDTQTSVIKPEKPVIESKEPEHVPLIERWQQDTNQIEIVKKDVKAIESVKQDNPIEKLDIETILELFVSGDRALRTQLTKEWKSIEDYKFDLRYGRVSHLLSDTELRASNDHFLAVSHPDEVIVDELNSTDLRSLMIEFTEKVFGKPRVVYAMSQIMFESAVSEFNKRSHSKTLPKPRSFELTQAAVVVEVKDDIQEGLFDLFGKENVEIV